MTGNNRIPSGSGSDRHLFEKQDDLDVLLVRMFQNSDDLIPDPGFTTSVMNKLAAQQRLRKILLAVAGLLGLGLAAPALLPLSTLLDSLLQRLTRLTTDWVPSYDWAVTDLTHLNGVLLVLTLTIAMSLFSGLIED